MIETDWLSKRTPTPPKELAAAIRSVLKARGTAEDPTPTQLLEAAQTLLERVLESECTQRESALDLLTADALVTYALEIANEKSAPADFAERAIEKLAGMPQ